MSKEFENFVKQLKLMNKYLPFEDNVVKIKVKDLLSFYEKIIELEKIKKGE